MSSPNFPIFTTTVNLYSSTSPSGPNLKMPNKSGKKRVRTAFHKWQLEFLETQFQTQQYCVGQQRKCLAKLLGLNEVQVKVWFQNRRIRMRREERSQS